MNQTPFLIVLVFNFIVNYATGLYFHLGEGEHKCFIEEVPSDTIVTCKIKYYYSNVLQTFHLNSFSFSFIAHYKIELYDSRSGGFAPPSHGEYSKHLNQL